jgi:(E)-4-hydroxy-3-methylbut-2-enyl-diphosphate synthase
MAWRLVQTMTTTSTRDVAGTVEQVKRCADLGADIVRITVQGKQEAEACHRIREQLFKDRSPTPTPSQPSHTQT